MDFGLLPSLACSRIAHFLCQETPFRDKYDIASDAVYIRLSSKCLEEISHELVRCIDSNSKNGKFTPLVLKNIQTNNYRLISRTTAKTWGLSDDELKQIPHKTLRGTNVPVLYRLKYVKKMSAYKFGCIENLKAYKSSKQIERYNNLERILVTQGVSVRVDSKLCDSYIKTGRGDPENIAKLLKEMEFYHIYTDYNRFFNACMARHECEYGYYDRDQISLDAKKQALNDFIRNFPNQIQLIPNTLHRFISG